MMINGTYVGHDEQTRTVTNPPGSMWAGIPIAPTALGPICIRKFAPGAPTAVSENPNAPFNLLSSVPGQ